MASNESRLDQIEEEEDTQRSFKKCEKCTVRPASIMCKDCGQKENRPALYCYTCSRLTHEDLDHNYEYACYNGMIE